MGYYDLPKKERKILVLKMENELKKDLEENENIHIIHYSSDEDVYIRKNVSSIFGRIYHGQDLFKKNIIQLAGQLLKNDDEKVRQTAVYLLGEIGKQDADPVSITWKLPWRIPTIR